MTHELARYPAKRESIREPSLQLPQQPMLPFEDSVPASSDELKGQEMAPCEVWEALSGQMKTEVHRDCLRTMQEVIGDGPQ